MKKDNLQQKIQEIFENTEDKNKAISEALTLIATEQHQELVDQIQEEARRAAVDAEYARSLNLHTPTQAEEKFYNAIRSGNIRQAIEANQIDIIPTETIDRTLDSVKKASDVLSIINYAPANVKKWISASKSGKAVWGELTAALDRSKALGATFSVINMELGKMWALLIIPKAIADLALPFVDRYFTAILAEAMQDGLEEGFISGKGQTAAQPIGILQTIAAPATAKTKRNDITMLNPIGLAEACVTLSTTAAGAGQRAVEELHLICNPLDYFRYVRPAMLVQNANGAWVDGTGMNIRPHQTANMPAGTAVIGLANEYTMGSAGIEVKNYDQTLALEDADLVIAKVYANGRAVDDNAFIVFDPTKLLPAYLNVKQIADAEG